MAKAKIAIIEDDLAIVQMYRMKFELEGFQVESSGDGKSGLELIKSFNPDVVLLDLMMPVMGGQEMLKKLRGETWGKHQRVVILTNMGEAEASPEIRSLGVDDFIVKADLTPKQVVDRIQNILQK